jgi:tol-pal system protein YbgF
VEPAPGAPTDTVMLTPDQATPAPTTALSGSARDEYDLAYGYILTGDYGLAEESFKAWLATFPGDPQAADAEFWLGESHLQQGEYREAANAFLAVYKEAPESTKGPDALLKLGVSLSALGEKPAACATFAELGRRYPRAAESVMSRVRDEQGKAGCAG